MAQQKTKSALPAAAHAFVYTLCYLPLLALVAPSKVAFALLVIGGTHYIIDRYRLARYVCWGKNFLAPSSTSEYVPMTESERLAAAAEFPYRHPDSLWNPKEKLVTTQWHHPWAECSGTGYHKERPPWMAVWLMILADNTLHLTINAAAIIWAAG
jgi:hypothetical protein